MAHLYHEILISIKKQSANYACNSLYESPENDAELKKEQSQNVAYSIISLTNILKTTA